MEHQRLNGQTDTVNSTDRCWFFVIGAVWALPVILYAMVFVPAGFRERRLTQRGHAMTQAFAQNAGLTMLDRDVPRLRAMLAEMAGQHGVLHASVIVSDLKEQLIRPCKDIINRLSINDSRPGPQARGDQG